MTEWLNANGTDMKPIENTYVAMDKGWIRTNSNTHTVTFTTPFTMFRYCTWWFIRISGFTWYFPKDNWKLNENKRGTRWANARAGSVYCSERCLNSNKNDQHIERARAKRWMWKTENNRVSNGISPKHFNHYLYKLVKLSLPLREAMPWRKSYLALMKLM